ncbi:nucleotidyltransferase domain-containing protein [Oscillochloris sp. ZM17-4]|uniref:nucleotidyltransferase family protein n=1 Tax=Oscillochloris sp. ZM17-4 TaxID=2866714 RepID=UPI001C73D4DA|nr:nucleotidyltransferase domain-containing protein [Oscillochloris sp. ZM17-4]MBX0326689.1 nucleotidyltransferase domain-containing protein [Oscillochloris sp. ZM17-4]
MDHPTRVQLARDIAARLAAAYGERIVVGGVYGSTARGDDTEWSDLDLLVVTQGAGGPAGRSFLFQGIAVGVSVLDRAELERTLTSPGPRWPFWMGVLDVLQPLVGDRAQVRRWVELGQTPEEQIFHAALEAELPGLVFESYGRIRSCAARGNLHDAPIAAFEVLAEMQTALCLLNRRWVTRDYYGGLEQAFGFPLLPDGYARLAPQLWAARELPEIVTTAGALVAGYWRLLATCGLNVPNYQRAEDIPLG